MPFPQLPSPARTPTARKKLQKAPRQRYRTSPKQPFRTVPLTRSTSARSDNSRGHLLPSDAQNRHVHFARYPPRPNQPSVLRKRRNDSTAGRRPYHTFPHAASQAAAPASLRYPTGYVPQHESPDRYHNLSHEPLLQRVPEQETVPQEPQAELSPLFPEPELAATEHGVLQQPATPLHPPAGLGVLQQSTAPMHSPVGPGQILQRPALVAFHTTSWAQRRWTMSEPLPSTSATAVPVVTTNAQPRPVSQRLEKALPELPEPTPTPTHIHPKQFEASASSSSNRNRDSFAPPPLYTEELRRSASFSAPPPPQLDTAYHSRLIHDFIRDERTYLDTLRQSVKNEETFTTSVDLLLSLLSVIQTSNDLLARIEAERTLVGVSTAFLGSCRPLETALVKWSEEIVRMGREEEERRERVGKALPPTPGQDQNTPSSRNSLLKRVSVLLGRGKSGRRQGGRGSGNDTHQPKPDPLWQARTGTSAPGLWEMSVLPSQRLTQYRYLLRGKFLSCPDQKRGAEC